MTLRKVDRDWLVQQITTQYGSLRKMAPKMTLSTGEPSNIGRLSLLLNGKTEPSVSEVLQFAKLFGTDLEEILKRFGYKIPRSHKH